MAMAASASTSATGPSLHDPLRPTPPPNVPANNANAVPWDEQVVPALRKRLEAESAQLAERIKGSSQHRASIQRGPPDGAQQYPSSPPSNSSGSVVFGAGAGAGAGSGVVRRGSKVDMDTARQRARAIRERRDSSAPIGGKGQDDGVAYVAQAQGENDFYSYGAGGSGSATLGRRKLKGGPPARGGGMLPPSSSSSTSSSAFFPSASAAHQQQELSSSPYRGAAVRPPSGSSSSSRVRTQSTPMQYMGPSSSRASSSSSSAAPARYAAAAPPMPQAQSRQTEEARRRNGQQQVYNDGGQRSRDGGQMGDFEMVPASHESRRYEPAASPNGARSGAASGTTNKYGEAMAPRWPSSQAHLEAPSAAPGTAAKLRSATVGGSAHFDAAAPSSRLPPSSSDPQLLDSFSPLSSNNAYTPTSRSTRAVTEPPPDLPGPSPWDWDEVLPPTIARRVAQEELLKRDPSLQGVEQLIDTWDRSGLPMTQKGIRDLVERSVSGGKEEEKEERGGSMIDGVAGPATTTAAPAAAPVQAEDPSSSSSYSYSSMPSSNNANRQVRLSSLVDGLGLGGSSSRDGGGQGSLREEGEGTRGSTVDTKASRRQQQQHQNALREEGDGERYQHDQQQQQQQQYAAQSDGQQGHGQTSASTAASTSKAGQKQQDDAHDAGCCASCAVM